ncbi:hypothetical protein C8Q76DRAFT_34379 [Earliella scabrosa]|nr:hypothetical protein C8Q76DRAFT_34379 [Earliella scabrosa]
MCVYTTAMQRITRVHSGAAQNTELSMQQDERTLHARITNTLHRPAPSPDPLASTSKQSKLQQYIHMKQIKLDQRQHSPHSKPLRVTPSNYSRYARHPLSLHPSGTSTIGGRDATFADTASPVRHGGIVRLCTVELDIYTADLNPVCAVVMVGIVQRTANRSHVGRCIVVPHHALGVGRTT